jgi:hypothetical protein
MCQLRFQPPGAGPRPRLCDRCRAQAGTRPRLDPSAREGWRTGWCGGFAPLDDKPSRMGRCRALDCACSPRRRTSGRRCREFIRPSTAEAGAPYLPKPDRILPSPHAQHAGRGRGRGLPRHAPATSRSAPQPRWPRCFLNDGAFRRAVWRIPQSLLFSAYGQVLWGRSIGMTGALRRVGCERRITPFASPGPAASRARRFGPRRP